MNNFKKIEKIEKEIQEYYEMSFEKEQDDYSYNKLLKNKIKQLIVDSKNSKSGIIDAALLLLAKSTGCSEDQEIADEIINYLHDREYITSTQLSFFYDNLSTKRWL